MNDQINEAPTLRVIINRIADLIDRRLQPGEVASLRRLKPDDIDSPAFWRIAAVELEQALDASGPLRDRQERRWAVITQALARLDGLHAPGRKLGRALAESDLSEQRFLKLLRAQDRGLLDAVRTVTHYLSTRAVPVDCYEIALLILSDGRSDEDSVRRSIARDYYSAKSRSAQGDA
jgi:CRISPR type I-E-associated protein CasB/Cse2